MKDTIEYIQYRRAVEWGIMKGLIARPNQKLPPNFKAATPEQWKSQKALRWN